MKPRSLAVLLCVLATGAAGTIPSVPNQAHGQEAPPPTSGERRDEGPLGAERWWEKEYPLATGERLMNLDATDIKAMEIFRLEEKDRGGLKKKPTHLPLEARLVRALLGLCKTASKARPRPEPRNPDRAMVVTLAGGEIFEIRYSSSFSEPFGGLDSPQLKEALWALGGHGSRCSVIHFEEGKVLGVTHCRMPAVVRGGEACRAWSASMNLDEQGRIVLSLKIRRDREVIMEDAQPIRYGEATTFRHKGPGHMIVLLHKPPEAY